MRYVVSTGRPVGKERSDTPLNQAFHPFYMFQVASLVLWSMDEYYYYAVCIFLISVFSIATTVLETRSVCF